VLLHDGTVVAFNRRVPTAWFIGAVVIVFLITAVPLAISV